MSFSDAVVPEYTKFGSSFKKLAFLETTPGERVVRILSDTPKGFVTHFVKGISVKCLGQDCPICQNNKQLMIQYPDTWKDMEGFIRSTIRYFVNVMDKTDVKVCPKCGAEVSGVNGQYPPTCPKCETFIGSVPATVSNKIKVWGFSKTILDELKAYELSYLDENKNPIGLKNFDLKILIAKTGPRKLDKSYKTLPMVNQNAPVEYKEEDLFNLDTTVVILTPGEIVDLLKGVSLKDIFTSRKSVDETATVESAGEAKDISAELEKTINEMFVN